MGGGATGLTPSLVRALSKKGVFIVAGITWVTLIGSFSRRSSNPQGLKEAVYTVLGGAVGALERDRTLGAHRGDVDQRPSTFALHVRQGGHRPVDLAHQVHVDHPRELLRGGLLEGSDQQHGGEVHPGVEPSVHLHCAVGHRLDLFEVGHLGGYGRGLTSFAPYLFDQGVQPLLVPGRNNYLGATISEPESRLAAYAAGGSHQRYHLLLYWLKSHTHRSLCFLKSLADLLVASAAK